MHSVALKKVDLSNDVLSLVEDFVWLKSIKLEKLVLYCFSELKYSFSGSRETVQ